MQNPNEPSDISAEKEKVDKGSSNFGSKLCTRWNANISMCSWTKENTLMLDTILATKKLKIFNDKYKNHLCLW